MYQKVAGFPYIRPNWNDLPWLMTFTTQARFGQPEAAADLNAKRPVQSTSTSEVFDFMTGFGEDRRRELEKALLPISLTWLALEHEDNIVDISGAVDEDSLETFAQAGQNTSPKADGAIISGDGVAVAFTTADCLPIVIASESKQVAAGVHAGWRSLASGIAEDAIRRLENDYQVSANDMRVWIGPSISREDYEVSVEVRDALMQRHGVTEACFTATTPDHYLADLAMVATQILTALGVSAGKVERYGVSTRQSELLHSARRDSGRAGRMATVVALTNKKAHQEA